MSESVAGPMEVREPRTYGAHMRSLRRVINDHPFGVDVLLAAAALAFAEWAIFTEPFHHGSRAVHAATAAVAAAVIVYRRRRPFSVMLVATALIVVDIFATTPEKNFGVQALAVLVAYSLGAYATDRQIVIGVAVFAPVFVLFYLRVPGFDSTQLVFDLLFNVAIVTLGRVVASWRRRAVALEQLTGELARERELTAELAVTAERGRIARELHDVLAHSVSVMVVQAQASAALLEGAETRAREALTAIETTGREALDEMRRVVGVLRDADAPRSPRPGIASLDRLSEQMQLAGLSVDVSVEGVAVPLPAGLDLAAYRIVQEALTNSLKHAGRTHASVIVRYRDDRVELEVNDDGGVGLGGGGGHGLVGLRERAALYGGALEAGKRPGGGFTVRAQLPLTAPAPA